MKAEETEKMENALLKGGAAWDSGKKNKNEKRARAQGEKRSKKGKAGEVGGVGDGGLADWYEGGGGDAHKRINKWRYKTSPNPAAARTNV